MTVRHPHAFAAIELVAAGFLLAACGSSSTPAPAAHGTGSSSVTSSTPTDSTTAAGKPVGATSAAAPGGAGPACALITQQEAGTALGTDPGPGQEIRPGHCIYGSGASSINIVEQSLPGSHAGFGGLRAAMAGSAVDVVGVGDAAFGQFDGPIATVEFYKGNTLLALSLNVDGASAPPKDQAITLAKRAASRL